MKNKAKDRFIVVRANVGKKRDLSEARIMYLFAKIRGSTDIMTLSIRLALYIVLSMLLEARLGLFISHSAVEREMNCQRGIAMEIFSQTCVLHYI